MADAILHEWRQRRGLLLALIVLGLLLDTGWRVAAIALDVARLEGDVREARALARPLTEDSAGPLSEGDYARIRGRTHAIAAALDRIDARSYWMRDLAGVLRPLPGGRQVDDSVRIFEAARALAREGTVALDLGAPFFDPTRSGLIGAAREVVVVRHAEVDAAFERAIAASAVLDAAGIEGLRGPLASRRDDLLTLRGKLGRLPEARESMRLFASRFDAAFGYERPMRYVVLGQNDQELRPTGGFIGSLGIITVADGQIVERDYRSSVAWDPSTPPTRAMPDPLRQFLGAGYWYVRDANWSPHFPATATTVLEMLRTDRGVEADGVIAIDSDFAGALIRVLGPFAISGFPEPVTGDNWFRLAEQAVTGEQGNPNAAMGTFGWKVVDGNTAESVDLAAAGITTAGLPVGVKTALRATYGGQAQLFTYAVEAPATAAVRGSIYVYVPPDFDGQARLEFSEFAGMTASQPGTIDASRRGQWQRVTTEGVTAADGGGNLRVWIEGAPRRGASLLVTAIAAEGADGRTTAGSDQAAKEAFLSPVLEAVLDRAQDAHGSELLALARATQRAADGRHFQAWTRDEQTEALLGRVGADGRLAAAPGEELIAIVDANLAYSKIQPAITRDTTLLLGADGNRDLFITWQNRLPSMGAERSGRLGKFGTLYDFRTGRYESVPGVFATYVRVFVPYGSTPGPSSGFDIGPLLSIEEGSLVIGGWVTLRPGEEKRVIVSYTAPPGEPPERIRLWKQGGLIDSGVRVLQNVGREQRTLFDGRPTTDLVVYPAPAEAR